MATISLSQVLASDTVNGMRINYNKNFSLIQNHLNLVETFLNTTPALGDLQIGNIKIKKGSNPITTILFDNEASGLFQGDLNVNGNLNLTTATSNLNVNGIINAQKDVLIKGNNSKLELGSPTSFVDFKQIKGSFIEEQFATAVPIDVYTSTAAQTTNVLIDNKTRVLYLDYGGYNGSSPTDAINLNLIPDTTNPPVSGQKIFIKFVNVPSTLPTTYTIKTNSGTIFNSLIYTLDITLSGTQADFLKAYLEIVNTGTITPSFVIISHNKFIF